MTRIVWGAVGERYFEAGTDRGVLFIDSVGFPWNGLKSVTEAPVGGEPNPFYIDGVKYLNIASREEFVATIQAFSAPPEFDVCDGAKMIHSGLSLTQQPRKSFGLSYRTKVGNDIDDLDLGYKIHLVYGALAKPSSRSNISVGANTEPGTLSWEISTTPPLITGYRPTAHVIIDSRTTSALILEEIEDLIYGSELANPALPTIEELIDIFGS
jgi:hypothetical protein